MAMTRQDGGIEFKEDIGDTVRLCRVCGRELFGSEKTIGVHVWCVQEVKLQPTTDIPGPNYGTASDRE